MRYQILLLSFLLFYYYGYNQKVDSTYKNEKRIVFKLKDSNRHLIKVGSKKSNNEKLNILFSEMDISKIDRVYPDHKKPNRKYNNEGNKLVDLSLIYEIFFTNHMLQDKILIQLIQTGLFEYVEFVEMPELLYEPNDTYVSSQYYLDKIKAKDAWEICQGDSSVVIGITDTGYDFENPDLQDQVSYNLADPVDGIDNDFDGYIDNFRGWDMGDNDNYPKWNDSSSVIGQHFVFNDHGVSIAGAASARTDNSTLIAGTGFKTKLLPVKIMNQHGNLFRSYEGIVYAADQGCDIVNCSWGGTIKSKYGQDIINYVTYNRDALVIAAAGNSDQYEVFYPASYENVLSVAGTDVSDHKWSIAGNGTPDGSSYGPFIDVCAPAVNILVINQAGIFGSGRGTSVASPIVAGAAGIAEAHHDTLSALQLGELLRVTSDNIDTVVFNLPYAGWLGSGRVNMLRAITDDVPPSIRFSDIKYNGDETTSAQMFDTINITGKFTNYLDPSIHCSAIISSWSPHIEIIKDSIFLGAINTMDTLNNQLDPFKVRVLPGYDYDEMIVIKISYQDTNFSYEAFEHFEFLLNPSYYHIDTNNLELTVAGNGRLCYADYYPLVGEGCYYKDSYNLTSFISLLVGVNEDSIAHCFSDVSEFKTVSPANKVQSSSIADCEVLSSFEDELQGNKLVGLKINMQSLAWNQIDYEDFIIFNYELVNLNAYRLDSLFISLYADFDLMNHLLNTFEFNVNEKMAYSKSNDGSNLYAAVKLLSNQSFNFYAFDFFGSGLGGLNLVDGFTDEEMYTAMRSSRYNAGFDTVNDIAGMLSAGPIFLNANDTVRVSFAVLAGIHYNDILESAGQAQYLYDSLFMGIEPVTMENHILKVYPVPSNGSVNIDIDSWGFKSSIIEITNIEGKVIVRKRIQLKQGTNHFEMDISDLKNGIYFVKHEDAVCKIIVSD